MTDFRARHWDWFRNVRIGQDYDGRVRVEYGEQVSVFSREDPVGEVLEEIRRLDLKPPVLTK